MKLIEINGHIIDIENIVHVSPILHSGTRFIFHVTIKDVPSSIVFQSKYKIDNVESQYARDRLHDYESLLKVDDAISYKSIYLERQKLISKIQLQDTGNIEMIIGLLETLKKQSFDQFKYYSQDKNQLPSSKEQERYCFGQFRAYNDLIDRIIANDFNVE